MTKDPFIVTFRGVRGSIPTPATSAQIEEKLMEALAAAKPANLRTAASRKAFVDSLPDYVRGCYGGNSSCIQMRLGETNLVFDGGTGIRELGNEWMNGPFGEGKGQAYIFFTHTHWDHIMGLPFFSPLYVKGNHFVFLSAHKDLKEHVIGQQDFQYFPVPFAHLGAAVEFIDLTKKHEFRIGGITVTWKSMDHPGGSYSYRVEYRGKSAIFATDAEYRQLGSEQLKPTTDFFRNADLLIFDSQYTFMEGVEKENWGHSSTFIGVDIALAANVRRIAFFHHEPTYSDFKLAGILDQTRKYLKMAAPESSLKMFLAREGLSVEL